MSNIILAIESSCDETSASVIINGKVINNIIATQSIHEKYGGVVPELASRAHQQNIIPVVEASLKDANIDKTDLSAIAYTKGPGLLGALLVGSSFAKSLAYGLGIPLISVNHMQAHILAHFIEDPKPDFPFICLTVSGGHTQIVLVKSPVQMEILGETKDDAVGEAFDKCAKILGLPYPGGPLIDKYATEGDSQKFDFPKTHMPDLEYSFSGIKTAFLYFIREKMKENDQFIKENMSDICASIQHTLVEMLMKKLISASKKTGVKQISIAGGVSANSYLRKSLVENGKSRGWHTFIPKFEYCTDNAGMIAIAAHFKFQAGQFETLDASPEPRMQF